MKSWKMSGQNRFNKIKLLICKIINYSIEINLQNEINHKNALNNNQKQF